MTDLFRTPGFLAVIVTNLAYLWVVAAILDTLVPLFRKEELGMSTQAIGVVFALVLITEFTVLYPAGHSPIGEAAARACSRACRLRSSAPRSAWRKRRSCSAS